MNDFSGVPAHGGGSHEAMPPAANGMTSLANALRALDGMLTVAVQRQVQAVGPESLLDPWRGMHLQREDVDRLLAAQGHQGLSSADACDALAHAARHVDAIASVAASEALSNSDLALLLIISAPDLDLKYEKIYGYLQDDLNRKRPTPDLLANLLARDAQERFAVLARLDHEAPLSRSGLVAAASAEGLPWLAQPWRPHPLWVRRLLGASAGSDEECFGVLHRPPTADTHTAARAATLCARLRGEAQHGGAVHLLISGPHGAGKYALACAVAQHLGRKVLAVDLRDAASPAYLRDALTQATRHARWNRALICLHGVGQFVRRDPQLHRALLRCLAEARVSTVVLSHAPLQPVSGVVLDALRVEMDFPAASERAALWAHALQARRCAAHADALATVAARFVLGPGQIEQAARDACAPVPPRSQMLLGHEDLAGAARAQCGAQLGALAQRITPHAAIDALVVPEDVRAQLLEICVRVGNREAVRAEWGAGSVHARTVGIVALFAGPSGTGKTLAAEAIAHRLGFDLYRIDLASVVSKYIGETEQNLDRVFAAAEHANAVLFFDEADALFGKRSEVKDAHDRYANIEIAFLLQKMERFDGLAVLATNLKQNLDEAFARRLTFSINFPFPETAERRRLWEALWPPRAPRADDVDFDWFAREFRLSGGAIRNTVLAAAHLAAENAQPISRAHLMHAARREFQKLGKNIGERTVDRRTLA